MLGSDKVVFFSFSFTHSLTPLVIFFGVGTSGVCFSVRKVLWRRKIIAIDSDFTEIYKDVIITAFGV